MVCQKKFNWKNLLTQHPIFSSLNESEIDWLLNDKVSDKCDCPEGCEIIKEGELKDSIFLIGSGSVQVILQAEKHGKITLATLKKGEFFGEIAAIQQKPRSATVKAKEDSVLLEIKGKEFLKIIEEHSDVASKVLLTLSERLRRISEHVLVRLKDVNEKIKYFNEKLDSEQKTVDATLRAAQTVFDQTKMRAEDIIQSAERSRTRLTVAASTISTVLFMVIAIFGWFGFSELLDIRKEADKIRAERKNVTELVQQAESERKKITELAQQAESDLKNVSNDLKQFQALRTNFYTQIMIPRFIEEMNKDIDKALRYYKATLEIADPLISDHLFDILNSNIFYVGGLDRKNSKEILDLGMEKNYVKTPRQKILSYYLILSAMILENQHHQEEFTNYLRDYKRYIGKNEGESFRDSLRKFLSMDVGDFRNLSDKDIDKKRRLEEVRSLIP